MTTEQADQIIERWELAAGVKTLEELYPDIREAVIADDDEFEALAKRVTDV